jgi:pimeloyl-ACP methyl ester carboxylesterase
MVDVRRLIYLHGSESTSQSGKARQFAGIFPGMITPDFTGSFEERMKQLYSILGHETGWILIGSSFGGTMAAAFAQQHPEQVLKLILLAPALTLPEFASRADLKPVPVPTVVVHGTRDDLVPLAPVRALAEKYFPRLTYHVVDDGHRLHKAFEELDWKNIVSS